MNRRSGEFIGYRFNPTGKSHKQFEKLANYQRGECRNPLDPLFLYTIGTNIKFSYFFNRFCCALA